MPSFHHSCLRSSERLKLIQVVCLLANKTLETLLRTEKCGRCRLRIEFFLLSKAQISSFCCPLDYAEFGRGSLPNSAPEKKAMLRELLKSAHCDSQLRLHLWDKSLTYLHLSSLFGQIPASQCCFLSNLTFTASLCHAG